MPLPNVIKPYALLLPALLLLATGCASLSTPSAPVCPTLPQPPAVTQPPPLQPYSATAQKNIEAWQKLLIVPPAIPAP